MVKVLFLQEKFREYNLEYFNGTIIEPTFEIVHKKSFLGQYHWKNNYDGSLRENVIRISTYYERSERDICNTLIHEMIHAYIRQNHIKDTRPHHGRVFNNIANDINRKGGWNIARTDDVDGCGLSSKKTETYYMACFFSGAKHKYFRFRINPKYLDYYMDRFDKYSNHFRDVFVYTSNDDKKYAHYATCYKSVRGWYISKEEFDTLRNTENLIFNMQTLGVKLHKVA